MTSSGRPQAAVAAAARRLAEALDLHYASARSWQVTRGELETTIALVGGHRERCVARIRPGLDEVLVRTPGGCAGDPDWVFTDEALADLVTTVARAVDAGLTRWDLCPGRRYRVTSSFRGLPTGTELVLHWIDELKPSGRDIYGFQHAGGALELYGDREQDLAILDAIERHLEWIADGP